MFFHHQDLTKPMRLTAVLVSSVIVLGGCTAPRVPSPETSRPVSAVPPPDSVVPTAVPLKWSPALFRIQIEARTAQADSTAADSSQRQAVVRLSLDEKGRSTTLTFETATDSADSTTSSTSHTTRFLSDPTGHLIFEDPDPAGCTNRAVELSPLLVRQLVYPVDPRVLAARGRVADSLVYSSCVQGVRVQSRIELEWTSTRAQSMPGTVRLNVQIGGQIRADSTRQFPMQFRGTVTGNSSLVFSESTLELLTLQSLVQSELEATAGTTRHQRFSQAVTYRATRDTAG